MSVTSFNFIPSKQAENSQTVQYTVPTGFSLAIDKFTVTNMTGAAVSFTTHLVPSSGSADATNKVMSNYSVAPDETYMCPELAGHVLDEGGFISTIAGAASSLIINASGRLIS